jgi:hypothetical protein
MESCDWLQGFHVGELQNELGIEVPGQENISGYGVSRD